MGNTEQQVKEFLRIETEEISRFIEKIDYGALEKAKMLILEAESEGNRVHVTGIGKPRFPHLKILVMYECLRLLA